MTDYQLDKFNFWTSKPDVFISPNVEAENQFKHLLKNLYDSIKKFNINRNNDFLNKKLPNTFCTQFMDEEGIWSQLDTENKFFLDIFAKKYCENEINAKDENLGIEENIMDDLVSDEFEEEDEEVEDKEKKIGDLENDSDENEYNEELNEEEIDENIDEELDLQLNEELNDNFTKENLNSDISDFESFQSDDDTLFNPKNKIKDYEKDFSKLKNKKDIKQEDDENEILDDDSDNEKKEDENSEDGNEDEDDDEDLMEKNFKVSEEKYKKKIQKLEKELLKEKPWHLKGETNASSRPENSLLEKYVDFDVGVKPVPVYTEDFSKKLNNIIIERIKNKNFDSVARKERKIEKPFEFKRRILLETEQNKEGLSKIYEKEYLNQKSKSNVDVEDPKKKEIRTKLQKLFIQLDALCFFNYVPISNNSEIKLINNLPAISVEEVIPATISEAQLIAPQEILPIMKGEFKNDTEKSKTDKLRERRKKKKFIKSKIEYKKENNILNDFHKIRKNQKNIKNKRNIASENLKIKNAFMKKRKN